MCNVSGKYASTDNTGKKELVRLLSNTLCFLLLIFKNSQQLGFGTIMFYPTILHVRFNANLVVRYLKCPYDKKKMANLFSGLVVFTWYFARLLNFMAEKFFWHLPQKIKLVNQYVEYFMKSHLA